MHKLSLIVFSSLLLFGWSAAAHAEDIRMGCDKNAMLTDEALMVKDGRGAPKKDLNGNNQYILNFNAYSVCDAPGKAHAGDIISLTATGFPSHFPPETANIKGVYFYRGDKVVSQTGAVHGRTNAGNGDFTTYFVLPVNYALTPGLYTMELWVNKRTCYGGPCRDNRVVARTPLEILPGAHPKPKTSVSNAPELVAKPRDVRTLEFLKTEIDPAILQGSSYPIANWELLPNARFTLFLKNERLPNTPHQLEVLVTDTSKRISLYTGTVRTNATGTLRIPLKLPQSLGDVKDSGYSLVVRCLSQCATLGFTEIRTSIHVRANMSISVWTDLLGGRPAVTRAALHLPSDAKLLHVDVVKPDFAYSKGLHVIARIDGMQVASFDRDEVSNVNGSFSFTIARTTPLARGTHTLEVLVDRIVSCDKGCKTPYSRKVILTVDPADVQPSITFQPTTADFGKRLTFSGRNFPPNTRIQILAVGIPPFETRSNATGSFTAATILPATGAIGATQSRGVLHMAFNVFQILEGQARTFTIYKDVPYAIECNYSGIPQLTGPYMINGKPLSFPYDLASPDSIVINVIGSCFSAPETIKVTWKSPRGTGSVSYMTADAVFGKIEYPLTVAAGVFDGTGLVKITLDPSRVSVGSYRSPDYFIRNGLGDVQSLALTFSSGGTFSNEVTIPILQQYALAIDTAWQQETVHSKDPLYAYSPGDSLRMLTRGFMPNKKVAIIDLAELKAAGIGLESGWSAALDSLTARAGTKIYVEKRSDGETHQREYPLVFSFTVPQDITPGTHTFLVADPTTESQYPLVGTETDEYLRSLRPRGIFSIVVRGEPKKQITNSIKTEEDSGEKKNTDGANEEKELEGEKYCDPNVANIYQRKCIERPEPENKEAIVPKKCDHAVPGYAQPKCIM